MKKAIAAAILLALLFGAAAWNIAHIDSLTGSLTVSADEALAHCRAEDYDAAEAALREAIERWYGAENYTHIMIRHAEVDSATDAFTSRSSRSSRTTPTQPKALLNVSKRICRASTPWST